MEPPLGEEQMSDKLKKEIQTFEREKKRLEKDHPGKYVLIHKDEVVNTFDSFETAVDAGLTLFAEELFLVRQIGSPQPNLPPAVLHGLMQRANC
jgi:hypothetical protein